jgi:hypothetical protein
MPRTSVRTPLGDLWVNPDERSLRHLAHHLAQPGGFLVIGTGARYIQAARPHHGELVLEYRDVTHLQTHVADTQAVLAAFAEFWAGSTAFLDRHQWGPVHDISAPDTYQARIDQRVDRERSGPPPETTGFYGESEQAAVPSPVHWRGRGCRVLVVPSPCHAGHVPN